MKYTKNKQRICLHCGINFESPYPVHKYCSTDCVKAINAEKARQKWRDIHFKIKECPICHGKFDTISVIKMYCSSKCGKRASYERLRDRMLEEYKLKYKTDPCYRERNKINGETYRAKNSEKIKLMDKLRRNTEEYKEHNKNYVKHNKGSIVQNRKRYYEKHKERLRIKHKQYRDSNLKEYRARCRINTQKHRVNKMVKENQRRKKEGLPLIGENYYHESLLKKLLCNLFCGMSSVNNKYWSFSNGGLINSCSHGGLQLDIFYPNEKIAFEYDGRQHFEFIPKFHKTIKDVESYQDRDKRKDKMCKKAEVALIRINYREKLNESTIISKFLSNELLNQKCINEV